MPNCQFLEPRTIDEACALLREHGHDARLVAGGQNVSLGLRSGQLKPRVLISLRRIEGLTGLHSDDGNLVSIGALTVHEVLATAPLIARRAPLLRAAAASITDLQVRLTGTLGGALASNYPACDPGAALIALDATATLRSTQGARVIPIEKLEVRPTEVLVEVDLPPAPPGTTSAFEKFVLREGDFAVVAVAVSINRDATGHCRVARLVIENCAAKPMRALKAEQKLIGNPLSEDVIAEAVTAARAGLMPFSEPMASGDYKRHLVAVLLRKALTRARDQAQ